MPVIRYHVALDDAVLEAGFEAIRHEFDVPDHHPADALAEAEQAARSGPTLPPGAPSRWDDRRDLELVAIDPPGSRDLDQAYTAERTDDGYRIQYAIADVAAFVAPGGALETEALDRGVTLYAPDRRTSLHPERINEDAASLLPGQTRPAVLWTIDLDPAGEFRHADVRRATVEVREAMTYQEAQDEIADRPRPALALLREIGSLRADLERARGAVSLALPSQEIRKDEHGHVVLAYDETLPVERWNAHISLLTGIAAARLMLDAGVGILRTLPPADDETIDGLRRTARHLEVAWPDDQSYADRVRTLDPARPAEAALLMRSARALRGAGYVAFERAEEIPDQHEHSAIAAPYAHVTAPLRRVCDRYANEVVLAVCAGVDPSPWAVGILDELPSVMGRTRQREQAFEKAILDYLEAMVLSGRVGAVFDAVVVNHRREAAVIQLREPAVIATLEPRRPLGEVLRVRLTDVDLAARTATFEPA